MRFLKALLVDCTTAILLFLEGCSAAYLSFALVFLGPNMLATIITYIYLILVLFNMGSVTWLLICIANKIMNRADEIYKDGLILYNNKLSYTITHILINT